MLIVLGVIGLLIGAVVMAALAMRATGHLPLTKASSRLVGLATWIPPGLIIGSFALWTLVAIAAIAGFDAGDPNAGTIGGVILLIGILLLVGGLVGRLVVTPLVCPRGKVTLHPGYPDKLVEIRNVHPAFVAAVTQIHQARAQQYASMQAPANVPLPPGSN